MRPPGSRPCERLETDAAQALDRDITACASANGTITYVVNYLVLLAHMGGEGGPGHWVYVLLCAEMRPVINRSGENGPNVLVLGESLHGYIVAGRSGQLGLCLQPAWQAISTYVRNRH
jgi:hypothetical protein